MAVRCTGKLGFRIVESDLSVNSLFEAKNEEINQHTGKLCKGPKLPALRRRGETDDKTEELI